MIYDISQEVFSGAIYPGDPAPSKKDLMSINKGYLCNLTGFSMCAHNGTHIDAPFHFINEGKTVDQIPTSVFAGPAWFWPQSDERPRPDVLREAGAAVPVFPLWRHLPCQRSTGHRSSLFRSSPCHSRCTASFLRRLSR